MCSWHLVELGSGTHRYLEPERLNKKTLMTISNSTKPQTPSDSSHLFQEDFEVIDCISSLRDECSDVERRPCDLTQAG